MAEPASLGSDFDAVLDAAKIGDGAAFERLYHLLQRRVYAFVKARGCPDPEEVVSEVFLQVFTGLTRFEGAEPQFKAWVFRIARNKLIDDGRRRRRRPFGVGISVDTSEVLVAGDDPERDALSRLGSASLLSFLDVLTNEQRDVVLLRVVADLPIADVAQILGRTPGSVKAMQHRALRTLAREMSSAGRIPFPCSDVPGS